MCVVCGSFGQGAEGRLLACSQCGQCYHPYCVSIKVSCLEYRRHSVLAYRTLIAVKRAVR